MGHTPGGWYVADYDLTKWTTVKAVVLHADKEYEAPPVAVLLNQMPIVANANARLIAAAPETRDMLSLLLRTVSDASMTAGQCVLCGTAWPGREVHDPDCVILATRVVLSKSEGRS